MKKLAAWRLLLDGCMGGLVLTGVVHAAPSDVVIASPGEAQAFADTAPFVFAGQTLAVHAGFATDRPIVLEGPASIIVGKGARFELTGQISSQAPPLSAPLEKRGPGTLVLAGNNRYTSNTVLREGALALGGPAPLGHALYSLEQHAGTILKLEPGVRVLNFIQLSGQRAGDLSLPGVEGEVQGQVASDTATLVNNVNALVPIRKTGAGSLRIMDTVQSQSLFQVDAGALIVDGMVTGRVDVGSGARLEGTGGLAGIRVGKGGMVAPGGREAVATLSVWGDVEFEPDAVFHVNVHADGRSDLLDVFGGVRLDGRVWAQAATGKWEPEHRYLILAAGGGLDDTAFAGVDANLAFLDPELEYDTSNVYLTLRRNDLGLGDIGETPDDEEVGDAIDSPAPRKPVRPPKRPRPTAPPDSPAPEGPPLPEEQQPPAPETPDGGEPPVSEPSGDAAWESTPVAVAPADHPPPSMVEEAGSPLTPLQEAMLGMSQEQARSALRQLSGSWHASVRSLLMEDSRYVREAVLASAPDAGEDDFAGPEGLRTWAYGYAAAGRRQAAGNVPGDRHGSRGVVLGLDAPASRHWRVGGVFAGGHVRLERDGRQASASIDSMHAGLSAHGRRDGMRVTAGLLHAWHRIDSRRRVSAGPLWDVLGATYTGRSWQAFVEFAPRLRSLRGWGDWLRGMTDPRRSMGEDARLSVRPVAAEATDGMGPYLRHEWIRLQVPGYREKGGDAAHGVWASTARMHATTLGWRLHHDALREGRPFRLSADIGWRRVLGDPGVASTQQFGVGDDASSPPSRVFRSQGLPLASNALVVGLGVAGSPRRNMLVSARYSGLYGSAYRDHAAWANLRWTF